LEDVIDPRNALEEMSRVAKKGVIYTPSRGFDMTFTHYDITDWGTGGRRVPGFAHHHWFFETENSRLIITPKNYPLLYSTHFQFIRWTGPVENEFAWAGKINYRVFASTSFHDLIDNYQEFVFQSRSYLSRGKVLIWIDNPLTISKAIIKKILGIKPPIPNIPLKPS